MAIVYWAICGLIAGVVAKWIMPDEGPQGYFVTILLGVSGAVVGGYLGTQLGIGDLRVFERDNLLLAMGGSLLLLVGYGVMAPK